VPWCFEKSSLLDDISFHSTRLVINHKVHQNIPPRWREISWIELMTAHHHPALTQPRQNPPDSFQGQLLGDKVNEYVSDLMSTNELTDEILSIIIEVVDEPLGIDA